MYNYNNNNKMIWCTGALAKSIFQLFCVWRLWGRRKGDPNINVVGKILNRESSIIVVYLGCLPGKIEFQLPL